MVLFSNRLSTALAMCVGWALWLWCFAAGAMDGVEGTEQLVIVPPTESPAGFNVRHLREKIDLYLAELDSEVHTQLSTDGAVAGTLRVELDWVGSPAQYLEAELTDYRATPARKYAFRVDRIRPWGAFERLLALKLRSTIRQAFDERAVVPEAGPPAQSDPPWFFELSGGAGVSTADLTPVAAAMWGVGVALSSWEPLLTASVDWPRENERREVLEYQFRGWLRYSAYSDAHWQWLLAAGGGVHISEVSSQFEGTSRSAQLVSPIVSAELIAGYRLAESWTLVAAPHASWLSAQQALTVAGEPVFDTGRGRFGARVGLRIVF